MRGHRAVRCFIILPHAIRYDPLAFALSEPLLLSSLSDGRYPLPMPPWRWPSLS